MCTLYLDPDAVRSSFGMCIILPPRCIILFYIIRVWGLYMGDAEENCNGQNVWREKFWAFDRGDYEEIRINWNWHFCWKNWIVQRNGHKFGKVINLVKF